MSIEAVIFVVVAAIVLGGALLLVNAGAPRWMTRRRDERELSQRRSQAADAHREAAETRRTRAETAEQQAQMERAATELHASRAELHEPGLADQELVSGGARTADRDAPEHDRSLRSERDVVLGGEETDRPASADTDARSGRFARPQAEDPAQPPRRR